jgi:hypothetical protein
MVWERNGDTFTATLETLAGKVRFDLTVKRASARSWDWTVWHAGKPPVLARYGTAPTAQVAMLAAEVVAS